MLTLYNHNLSVCVQKVRLAMVEKGLAWEERNVDLMAGEQFSPDYLKIHPKGIVPAIVHDGRTVTESTVILEYLEDAFPERPLRQDSPYERARVRMWTKVPDEGLHYACGVVSFAAAFGQQVVAYHGHDGIQARLARIPDPVRVARQRELYAKGMDSPIVPENVRVYDRILGDMEKTLQHQPWLAGASYSLAECAILPYVWRLERLNLAGLYQERPRVMDWFARAKARPSWMRAMEAYPALGGHDYDDNLRARGVDLWPKVKAMLSHG